VVLACHARRTASPDKGPAGHFEARHIAARIAFVEIGDAKSAACGPVPAEAQANAIRTRSGKPRKGVGKVRESRRHAGDCDQSDGLDETVGLQK
jgi:hypothetical protein